MEDEDEASRRKQDEEEGIVDIYPPGLLNAIRKEQLERRKARQAALRGPSPSLPSSKPQEASAVEASDATTDAEKEAHSQSQAEARSAAMISVEQRPAVQEGVEKLRETNAWMNLAEVSRSEGEQGFWRDTAYEHLQTVLQICTRVRSVVGEEKEDVEKMAVDDDEGEEEQLEEERLVEIVDQDENKAFFISVRLEEEPYELDSDDERL